MGIARPISKILNPFSLSVTALLLVSYATSISLSEFSRWALVIVSFLVVLPIVYARVRTPLAAGSGLMTDPMVFFRQHRKELWLIGILCAVPCVLLLVFLEAPTLVIATLVALLVTSLAVSLVNRVFRASYHLAAVTTLVTVLIFAWGNTALPIVAVIPLIGWARYTLGEHSPAQMVAGCGLAIIACSASVYGFGLLG